MSTMSLKARKGLIAFVIFILAMVGPMIACDDGPSPSCDNILVPCPADVIMGDKSPIENAVENFVCDDGTCDNTLSGGN